MTKVVAIMFGGISAEHEVSVISGLQVAEKIDRSKYSPVVIYWGKDGLFYYYPGLNSRRDWKKIKPVSVNWGVDKKGTFVVSQTGIIKSPIYLDSAYLAFHGGLGESGPIQGMLESFGLPFTSPGSESSSVVMNKALGKTVLRETGIRVVDGVSILEADFKVDSEAISNRVFEQLGEVIVKPAHLGSSIGISIAKSAVELEKQLTQAFFIDNEVVVEKLLTGFVEYNCSVRVHNGQIETSEIERPIKQDEILSFADKYERGGNKKSSGMASLSRELPAKIDSSLREKIQTTAKAAFIACRCKGMVRIDFMLASDGELYLTEINPIPGSLAFYLWEASGISFRDQITDLIEESFAISKKDLNYESSIIDKFVQS